MANASVTSNGYEAGGGGSSSTARAPRLPRWTRQEILVLIQGKRVIEGRGRRRMTTTSTTVGGTPESTTTTISLEPKWAAVSTYCRRHGVERGAVQCRKRWSNLAGDFKKIKEWEKEHGGGKESFWAMRNDLRRERKLPGFFDKEVYDILDGVATPPPMTVPTVVKDEEEEDATVVFDSGRTAAEDGLFSDGEEEKDPEEDDEATEDDRPPRLPTSVVVRSTEAAAEAAVESQPVAVVPISEKKYEPFPHETSAAGPGMTSEKQPAAENREREYYSHHEGQQSKNQPRATTDDRYTGESSSVQQQLVQVLERNSRLIAAQLEAQNLNCQLDRDQRKEQADGMLNILGKLADALGRIADKL